jgi:uncharacterized protein
MRMPLWLFRWLHRQRLTRRHMRGGRMHSWLGDRLLDKSLWTPSAGSLARAWLVGVPITVVPFLPGQSVLAIVAALCVRGNVLLCVALQFLSNPVTAPVQISACYFVGEVLRGADPAQVWRRAWGNPKDLLTGHAAASLYIGSIFLGILVGAIGYAVILKTWRGTTRTRPPVSGTNPPIP